MGSTTCTRCKNGFDAKERVCPHCGTPSPLHDLDAPLKRDAERVRNERKKLGLEDLTGGLEFVVINTEPYHQLVVAEELLSSTGFEFAEAHEDEFCRDIVLSAKQSAKIVVRTRKAGPNPFASINIHRYGDFDGFFTKSNVTLLTEASGNVPND